MCHPKYTETARAALARAAWIRGETPDYGEDAVTDLLADIRHFCAAFSLDFGRCDRVAAMHFRGRARGRVMIRPLAGDAKITSWRTKFAK
jgi:hypothetical protein